MLSHPWIACSMSPFTVGLSCVTPQPLCFAWRKWGFHLPFHFTHNAYDNAYDYVSQVILHLCFDVWAIHIDHKLYRPQVYTISATGQIIYKFGHTFFSSEKCQIWPQQTILAKSEWVIDKFGYILISQFFKSTTLLAHHITQIKMWPHIFLKFILSM